MKVSILGLCFLLMSVQWSYAQQTKANPSAAEQEVINLSKAKMALDGRQKCRFFECCSFMKNPCLFIWEEAGGRNRKSI